MANEVVEKKSNTALIKDEFTNPDSGWAKELAKILPTPQEVGRFMAVAWAQFADPKVGKKLLSCTRNSIFACIGKAARSRIIPDGVNAYLIPYGQECTLQYSYRGLCDMAVREGIAKKFTGDVVRAKDIFRWSNGELVEHTITEWDEEERGDIVGVWVRAYLPDGDHQDLRMSRKEIDQIKAKSQNPNGVWREWYAEMAKKSAVKRLMKMMRNTPALQEAIATDNENYDLNKPAAQNQRVATNTVDFGDEEEAVDVEAEVIDTPAE